MKKLLFAVLVFLGLSLAQERIAPGPEIAQALKTMQESVLDLVGATECSEPKAFLIRPFGSDSIQEAQVGFLMRSLEVLKWDTGSALSAEFPGFVGLLIDSNPSDPTAIGLAAIFSDQPVVFWASCHISESTPGQG